MISLRSFCWWLYDGDDFWWLKNLSPTWCWQHLKFWDSNGHHQSCLKFSTNINCLNICHQHRCWRFWVYCLQDWPSIFGHRQQIGATFDHIVNFCFRWTLVIYKSFNQKRGYSLTNRKIHCGKPQMIWHIHRISTQFLIWLSCGEKSDLFRLSRQPILDADLDGPVTEWLLYWWIKNSFYIKVKIWTIWSVYY